MSQKHEDGPRASSRGHQFGPAAAADAGVPWGWVNKQESPELKERRARELIEEENLTALLARRPELKKYCFDEYGRRLPARDLRWIESKGERDKFDIVADERDRVLREEQRRSEALRQATAQRDESRS